MSFLDSQIQDKKLKISKSRIFLIRLYNGADVTAANVIRLNINRLPLQKSVARIKSK